MREACSKVDDITGAQNHRTAISCNFQSTLEGLKNHRHCRGVLTENLVLIEGEEHQTHSFTVHNRARNRCPLIDLNHGRNVLNISHNRHGDLKIGVVTERHGILLSVAYEPQLPLRTSTVDMCGKSSSFLAHAHVALDLKEHFE